MTQQSQSGVGLAGASNGGPLGVVAGIALLVNIVGLFTFTGVALCVFGYIGVMLFMIARAGRSAAPGRGEFGGIVMVLSWTAALAGGALVGGFHWVEFRHAAYVVLGLYALAVFIWIAGRAITVFWSLLFPLAGVAMLLAVTCLHAPPGADDLEKQENWTPVDVTVVDRAGRPVNDASVYLDLCQFWQGDPDLTGERDWWSNAQTARDGIAHMHLMKDPRFQAAADPGAIRAAQALLQ